MYQILLLTPAVDRSFLFRRVLLLLFLFALWETPQAAIPDRRDELLQFTASGHVLRFQSDGFYVASGDHTLHVGFFRSTGAVPEAASVTKENNRALPFNRVIYTDLWPGINLRHDAVGGGITESTWEITPGSSPEQIRLRYSSPVTIERNGSLKIDYASGWMHESAPIAWQKIDGHYRPVEVAFHLLETEANEAIVGFEVGHYEPGHPLLIDPTLTWNTFMGASADYGNDIALDIFGNVYVVGKSNVSWGNPVYPHAGNYEFDAFVAKLDVHGALIWNTFMGSTDEDSGEAIAVDIWGNVYVAGSSHATWGTPVRSYEGSIDAFAAKLDANGNLQWNTFMGSSSYYDLGNAIAVDFWGNRVYVAGTSGGTWGSPVRPYAGGGSDAFTAGLVSGSGALVGHTFLGSSLNDFGNGVALDGALNIYVAGTSDNNWGAPVKPHAGGWEAFVAKINDVGAFQWNTFLGGPTSWDYGNDIALDSSGNIHIAGTSTNTWGMPVNAHTGGERDAFTAKLDVNGNLLWNTFLGAADAVDEGNAIKVDGNSNVFIAGDSGNTWGEPVNAFKGNKDAFAAKLDSSGKRLLHTFMGSASEDHGNAIAVDISSNVYLGGTSMDSWGTPINDHADSYFDAFAAKLDAQLRLNTDGCKYFIFPLKDGTVFPVCL
jgi:hypothetical protein